MSNRKGDHRAQQHQGDNTQSKSTEWVTPKVRISEHCGAEISLQDLTCSSHKSLTAEAPPEEEQALK